MIIYVVVEVDEHTGEVCPVKAFDSENKADKFIDQKEGYFYHTMEVE